MRSQSRFVARCPASASQKSRNSTSSPSNRPGGQPATIFASASGSGCVGCQSMSIRRPLGSVVAFTRSAALASPCLSFEGFLTSLGAPGAGVAAPGAGVRLVRGCTSCAPSPPPSPATCSGVSASQFSPCAISPVLPSAGVHDMRGWTKYITPTPRASSRVMWPAAFSDWMAFCTPRSLSPVLAHSVAIPGQHLPAASSACHANRWATSCSVGDRSTSQNRSCKRRLTLPPPPRCPCRARAAPAA